MKHVSLGDLAIKLGINKSKLAYYYGLGLITPTFKTGKMHVYDLEKTIKSLEKIKNFKKLGKQLKDIKV